MSKIILIVDDEEHLTQAIAKALTEKDFTVRTAVNGRLALEKIKTEKPDLIIADVFMPEMDGFEFYKELKKVSQTASIPVIIQTERKLMEGSFRALGVEEFLLKPINTNELYEKIDLAFKTAEDKKKQAAALPAGQAEVSQGDPLAGQPAAQDNLEKESAGSNFRMDPQSIKLFSLGLGIIFLIFGSYQAYSWLLRALGQEASETAALYGVDKSDKGIAAYAVSEDAETAVDGFVEDYDDAGRLQAQLYYDKGKLLWKKI